VAETYRILEGRR